MRTSKEGRKVRGSARTTEVTNEAQRASSGGPTRFLKDPLRAQEKTQRAHHPCLVFGSLARCGRLFLGSLARSARLDPSACSLNARGALSVTVLRTIS